jgi:hypothetical protein
MCIFTHIWVVTGELEYAARIHGHGSVSDQGTSILNLDNDVGSRDFTETFTSVLAQVSPGKSPGIQPGRGCGDRNHTHESSTECP